MRGLRHEYWQDSQAQMKVLRAAHEKEVAGLREQLQSKSELIQQLQLRSRPARTQFNAVLSELKAGADGRAAGHTAAAAEARASELEAEAAPARERIAELEATATATAAELFQAKTQLQAREREIKRLVAQQKAAAAPAVEAPRSGAKRPRAAVDGEASSGVVTRAAAAAAETEEADEAVGERMLREWDASEVNMSSNVVSFEDLAARPKVKRSNSFAKRVRRAASFGRTGSSAAVHL